jgi:BirA family biotin operon repressor/biotin-[acetyl-CoA-carboxylase] ligase
MATSALKEGLLLYLRERKGQWVSGETLSRKMAVSRSAVWKQVSRLKGEGYIISSSPKKGYLLHSPSPKLLPREIVEGLDTQILGRREIVYLEETESTNTVALGMAAGGAAEGTLVVAEKQTSGRGRRSRDWHSPGHEGIYASFILRPAMSPFDAPKVNALAAVALAEGLLSLTNLGVRIKWPNDILINGRKAAGILTEIASEMDSVNYLVIGIGVNVNMTCFPEHLKDRATSLLIETGEPFSRVKLLQEILRQEDKWYRLFRTAGFSPVLRRWRSLTDMVGRRVKAYRMGGTFSGAVQGIGPDGVLVLKDSDGRSVKIYSGDIDFVE